MNNTNDMINDMSKKNNLNNSNNLKNNLNKLNKMDSGTAAAKSSNPADYSDTTIIIPTYNEEKNISNLVPLLARSYININILVSDDDSKDATAGVSVKLAERWRRIKVLQPRGKRKRGLTASVVDGIKAARSKFFVVMDADFQHPPEKVADIVESLRKGNDVVIGVRRSLPGDWPFQRKLISKTATALGNLRLLISGRSYRDVMSGFFGMQTEIAQQSISGRERKFEMRGYKVLFDILKCSKKLNADYVEYDFRLRKFGESKLRAKHIILYLKSLLK